MDSCSQGQSLPRINPLNNKELVATVINFEESSSVKIDIFDKSYVTLL